MADAAESQPLRSVHGFDVDAKSQPLGSVHGIGIETQPLASVHGIAVVVDDVVVDDIVDDVGTGLKKRGILSTVVPTLFRESQFWKCNLGT